MARCRVGKGRTHGCRPPGNLSGGRGGLFDPHEGQTAPPAGKNDEIGSRRRRPEAGGGGVGGARPGQGFKGVLTRPLTRFCGADRWGWRATAAAGVRQGELGERSEPNAGSRGGIGRVPASATAGGGGAGEAKSGQGGGRTRHYLEAVLRSGQVGAGGRRSRHESIESRAAKIRRLSISPTKRQPSIWGVRTTGIPN